MPADVVLAPEQQETHAGGVDGIAHDVHEPAHALRQAEAHGRVEDFLGELDGAFHLGAAAGEHDARGDRVLETGAREFVAHQHEDLLVARFDDARERLAREAPRRSVTHARHLDGLVRIREL